MYSNSGLRTLFRFKINESKQSLIYKLSYIKIYLNIIQFNKKVLMGISVYSKNIYKDNNNWILVKKDISHLEYDVFTYRSHKQSTKWAIGRISKAIINTIAIIPLIKNYAHVKNLYKTGWSRIDIKTIRVEKNLDIQVIALTKNRIWNTFNPNFEGKNRQHFLEQDYRKPKMEPENEEPLLQVEPLQDEQPDTSIQQADDRLAKILATLALLEQTRLDKGKEKQSPEDKSYSFQKNFEHIADEDIFALQDKLEITNPDQKVIQLNELGKYIPNLKVNIDNATYYVSIPFKFKPGYFGIYSLIQIEDRVFPRVFYRSNSQSYWRTLPALQKTDSEILRLGKGHSESDTQLPIALNLLLLQLPLPSEDIIYTRPMDSVEFGFDMTNSYKDAVTMDDTFIAINGEDHFRQGGFYIPKVRNPKDISIPNEENLPNFGNELFVTSFSDPLYGELKARVFQSKNQQYQYLFYETRAGYTFLAHVEKIYVNDITSFGNRKIALEINGLDSPLLEYATQIPNEYRKKIENKRYEENWNYVRNFTIIERYYTERGLSLPEAT